MNSLLFNNCFVKISDFFQFTENDFLFFESNSKAFIPLQLTPRNNEVIWIALIGLIISVLILALSRFGSSNYIGVFSRILIKNNSINKIVQDEYSLSSIGSILLVLNYIVSSTTLLYLTYQHFYIKYDLNLLYILPIFPIYFFLWPLICFNFIGFISNERNTFNENKKNVVILTQIIGIIFSAVLLLWTFNLKWSDYFIYFFISVFILMWFYKIIRGIIFSLQHNVAWYYIILYFCTLEILPIISIYLFLL